MSQPQTPVRIKLLGAAASFWIAVAASVTTPAVADFDPSACDGLTEEDFVHHFRSVKEAHLLSMEPVVCRVTYPVPLNTSYWPDACETPTSPLGFKRKIAASLRPGCAASFAILTVNDREEIAYVVRVILEDGKPYFIGLDHIQ